jgi:HlyD family secretion protein
MSASVDIQTKRHENVLSVPINAVTTREKGSDKAVAERKSSFGPDGKPVGDQPEEKKGIK